MSSANRPAPSYGIDAPTLVLGFAITGALLLALGALGLDPFLGPSLAGSARMTGSAMMGSAVLMILSSRFGKRIVARRLIASLHVRGNEQVLDVGCGRGQLLLEAARHLPRGGAIGIDLWSTRDQSGNASAATRANAIAAGVDHRVRLDTGDMRKLPYADASFDAIVSSLAIHNIATAFERAQAVREIARVLKPGGRIALLDFRNVGAYARTLRESGLTDVRCSRPNLLMFPPVRIVYARKP